MLNRGLNNLFLLSEGLKCTCVRSCVCEERERLYKFSRMKIMEEQHGRTKERKDHMGEEGIMGKEQRTNTGHARQ